MPPPVPTKKKKASSSSTKKNVGKKQKPAPAVVPAEAETFGFDEVDEAPPPPPAPKKKEAKKEEAPPPVAKGEKGGGGGGGSNVPPKYQPRASFTYSPDKESMKVAVSESDNSTAALNQEDIRLGDRSMGFKTATGKGDQGGTVGGIANSKRVNQMASEARSTLITHQPGRVRSADGFAPYLTPVPADVPGGTILVVDLPRLAGPGGKLLPASWNTVAKRVSINKTAGKMGAQVCIETYWPGKDAVRGQTEMDDEGNGHWVQPSASKGIARETIRTETFNISQVAKVTSTTQVMSTLSEQQIEIARTVNVDVTKIEHPAIPDVQAVPDRKEVRKWITYDAIGLASCCSCCAENETTMASAETAKKEALFEENPMCCFCFDQTCCTTLEGPEFQQVNKHFCKCCACWLTVPHKGKPFKAGVKFKKGKAAWTEELFNETVNVDTKKNDDPFDIVAVTELSLILKNASNLDFKWRVQSVGETETDLQYQLAKEYRAPCQDPTSTARTIANVIHYLNDT